MARPLPRGFTTSKAAGSSRPIQGSAMVCARCTPLAPRANRRRRQAAVWGRTRHVSKAVGTRYRSNFQPNAKTPGPARRILWRGPCASDTFDASASIGKGDFLMALTLEQRERRVIADTNKIRFFPFSVVRGEGAYLI